MIKSHYHNEDTKTIRHGRRYYELPQAMNIIERELRARGVEFKEVYDSSWVHNELDTITVELGHVSHDDMQLPVQMTLWVPNIKRKKYEEFENTDWRYAEMDDRERYAYELCLETDEPRYDRINGTETDINHTEFTKLEDAIDYMVTEGKRINQKYQDKYDRA